MINTFTRLFRYLTIYAQDAPTFHFISLYYTGYRCYSILNRDISARHFIQEAQDITRDISLNDVRISGAPAIKASGLYASLNAT